jgi:hypothetical protein
VTLEESDGRETRSPYSGLEYRYNAQRGDVDCHLYLLMEGREALQRAMARAGDCVEIPKSPQGGQHVWSARILPDTQEPSQPRLVPPQPVQLQPIQPQPIQPQPIQPKPQRPLPSNGVRPQPPQPASEPHTRSNPPRLSTAALLEQCLMCAVDAALSAEHFAASKGVTLEFNEEDIRAMAISVYIAKTKQQDRSCAA